MRNCKAHRLITILAMLVLGFSLLAGCSTEAPTEEATGPTGSEPTEEPGELILVTTTSTYDSGLLDVLIPIFEGETGYTVKPIPVGTGAALAMAERGEADVVLVHAPPAERELVEKGAIINRQLVMHNDFVFVGPTGDPAGIRDGVSSATEVLAHLHDTETLFISRGDDSGTHKKEKALWTSLGVQPTGTWYQETGEGMGHTLGVASEKQGYTFTDRGTFLALKPNLALEVVFEGDPVLLNIYHVAQVNPDKHPEVEAAGAEAFVEFMLRADIQELIGSFGVDEFGEPLFAPDGGKTEDELLGGK